MDLDPLLQDATTALTPTSPTPVQRRQGTVTAVTAGPPRTISVVIGTTTIPNVACLAAYIPTVGDVVWVDFNGPDPLIIGSATIGRHLARARRITSNQALNTGVFTTVVFNDEVTDESGAYNPANGAYTALAGGLYDCRGRVRINGTAITNRAISFFVNGAERLGSRGPAASDPAGSVTFLGLEIATYLSLAAGDEVTLRALGTGTSPIIERIDDTGAYNWLTILRRVEAL